MSIGQILFQFFIRPLELIFEIVYGYSKVLLGDSGLSIIVLSLCMNLLLLPLYNRADAIQEAEREKGKSLARWVDHIKKTFSGDERFMLLQTYYRQNDYKPYYALKGLLPLLLEIPFFMAAYHFLSHLSELVGYSFGPIASLGSPDGLLKLGGVTIHVLPVLMTLINLLSGALYTKGQPLKEKLQLFAMAGVFLVLLYNSPSGLVLYWTLNNLFSLVKNLIRRIPGGVKRFQYAVALLCALGSLYVLFIYRGGTLKRRIPMALILLLLAVLLVDQWRKHSFGRWHLHDETKSSRCVFWGGCVLLTLLTGLLIPASVIRSSPGEFVQLGDYYSPLRHLVNALLIASGLFLVWLGIFYGLAGKKIRWGMGLIIGFFSVMALVNYMFFGTDLGTISPELQFEVLPVFGWKQMLLNLAVLLVLLLLWLFLWLKKQSWVLWGLAVLSAAVLGMGGIHAWQIQKSVPELRKTVEQIQVEDWEIPLSSSGKNVVVIMLDRAVSAYLPCIFEEKPELKGQFAGFTYYPNTLSFGAHTNIAGPALYGGYEYTPERINARTEELLKDKHTEALQVMPALFHAADYEVTVIDPPYPDYTVLQDMSVFEKYPGMHSYVLEQSQGMLEDNRVFVDQKNHLWSRNFFCYSLMKSLPLMLQGTLYQGGSFFIPNGADLMSQSFDGLSRASGNKLQFLKSHTVLRNLPEKIRVKDDGNTFLCMSNLTTHEQQLLAAPAYEPTDQVDNVEYDSSHMDRFLAGEKPIHITNYLQMSHYHVNAAALLRLGDWMDALRRAGVYDNTRIIIVADHGDNQNSIEGTMFGPGWEDDAMYFNPLFLVKDFDSRDFRVDRTFMTNADTPAQAFEGLIDNPVNPFTGAAINCDAKAESPQKVFASHEHNIEVNNGTVFMPGAWYGVQGEVLDQRNWTFLGEH